jgi:hypothetical protein
MQPLPVNSLNGSGLLMVLAVCAVAVAFMIWFLIALILDTRKAERRKISRYRIQTQVWVRNSADDDFDEEAVYARRTLGRRDRRVFRDVDRLRAVLRSHEVSQMNGGELRKIL